MMPPPESVPVHETTPDEAKSQVREVAYSLLIELLAHQFAFPVQWIDTQDVLFERGTAIERFVELGPSNVLVNMAKKTRDSKYFKRDTLLCLDRLFLASAQDTKQIQYQYVEEEAPVHEESEESRDWPTSATPNPVAEIMEHEPLDLAPQANAVAASSIADVPVTSLEIIKALIAYKTRKPVGQVSSLKSIKDLSAGKSTLQNEIVGDISNEFGSSPDGAESMSLDALSELLEPSSSGQLGRTLSELIARFISSIMPARFNLTTIRDYLGRSWGLGQSRQTSVLLIAMTQSVAESSHRLPSITEAKKLLDTAAAIYARSCGLTLQQHSAAKSTQSKATSTIDASVLEKLTQEHKVLPTMHYKMLGNYLDTNSSSDSELVELEKLQQSCQERLDLWLSELGADFEVGVKPRFNPKHLRQFNFWWNQARIEIYKCFTDVYRIKELPQNVSYWTRSHLQRMANKSGANALTLVRDLIFQSVDSSDDKSHFGLIGKRLAELITISLQQPPCAKFSLALTGPRTEIEPDGLVKCIEVPRFSNKDPSTYVSLLQGSSRGPHHSQQPHASLQTQNQGHWDIDADMTAKLFDVIGMALIDGMSFSRKTVLVTGAGQGSIGIEIVRKLLMGGATVIVTTSRSIVEAQKIFRDVYAEDGARGSELLVLPFNQASARDCGQLVDYIYDTSGLNRNIDIVIPFAAMSEPGIEIDGIESRSELAHRMMLVNVLRLVGCIIKKKRQNSIHCYLTQILLPLSPNHGTFGGDGLYSESKLGLESLLNRFSSESWGDQISVCGVIIGWTRGTGLMESNDVVAETVESHKVLTFSQDEMALNILSLLTPTIARLCEDKPFIADFGGGLQSVQNLKSIVDGARNTISQVVETRKAILQEDALERASFKEARAENFVPSKSKQRGTLKQDFPHLPDYSRELYQMRNLNGMADLSTTIVVVGFSELGPWGNSRTRWQMESQRKLSRTGYIELAWMMGLIKHFDGNRASSRYVGWIDAKTEEAIDDDQVEGKFGEYILSHSGIRLIEPEMLGGYNPNKKDYMQEIAIEDDMPEFDATLATAEAFKLKHGDRVKVKRMDEPDSFRVQVKAGAHIMVPKAIPLPSSVIAGMMPTGWDAAKFGISEDIISQVDTVTLYTICCVSEAFLSAGIEDPMEIFKHIHLSEIGNFIGSSLGGTEKNRQMFRDVYLDKNIQGDVIQETNLNTPAAWVNMLLLGGSGPIKTPVGACATAIESLDTGFDSIQSGKIKMAMVGGVDNFHEDESFAFSTMRATVDTAEQFAQGRTPQEMSRPTAKTRAGFVESQGCGVQLISSAEVAVEMGLPIYGIVAGTTMAADKISRSVPAPGQGILTFARESPEASHSSLLSVDYRREQLEASLSQLLPTNDYKSALTFASGLITPSASSDDFVSDYSDDVCINYESVKSMMSSSKAIAETSDVTLNAKANNIRRLWGNQFRSQQPEISPLRASLAVWGLSIDDLGIASLHATSTKANDLNEPDVINKQMKHLGRKGAPMLAISQKSVTGHPKAPAAAWMLNGCLQAMNTGIVPGNYNCDNIDPALEEFEHLIYPTEPLEVKEVKAFLLSSFGFGQKGGQMIGVAPKYLFATLDQATYVEYSEKCARRKRLANRAFAKAVMSNTVVKAASYSPYAKEHETMVLLDPLARGSDTPGKASGIHFDPSNLHASRRAPPSTPPLSRNLSRKASPDVLVMQKKHQRASVDMPPTTSLAQKSISYLLQSLPPNNSLVAIGIDLESLENFTSDANTTFVNRNYTGYEQDFALHSRDTHAMFVSRWCAKEAVFKSLGVKSKGAGAPMKDIEVWNDENGMPRVKLNGAALRAAEDSGIADVLLSISYGNDEVVAVAVSVRT